MHAIQYTDPFFFIPSLISSSSIKNLFWHLVSHSEYSIKLTRAALLSDLTIQFIYTELCDLYTALHLSEFLSFPTQSNFDKSELVIPIFAYTIYTGNCTGFRRVYRIPTVADSLAKSDLIQILLYNNIHYFTIPIALNYI